MQVAHIAPIAGLPLIKGKPVQFVIAPYVEKYPAYASFYKNEKGYKIIDNGAWELRKPMSPTKYLKIAVDVGADEIILPDYEFKPVHTLARTREFINLLRTEQHEHSFNYQLVLHGRDYFDMVDRASWLICEIRKMKFEINRLGIPLYNKDWTGRIMAVYLLRQKQTLLQNLTFHLLGLHDPIELMCYGNEVHSVDCRYAFKYGITLTDWYIQNPLPIIHRFDMRVEWSQTNTQKIKLHMYMIEKLARRGEKDVTLLQSDHR